MRGTKGSILELKALIIDPTGSANAKTLKFILVSYTILSFKIYISN